MYSPLGDSIPLILQGGGAYNTPPAPAAPTTAGVSPLLLFGGLGVLAAYLLASGKARGGKVW